MDMRCVIVLVTFLQTLADGVVVGRRATDHVVVGRRPTDGVVAGRRAPECTAHGIAIYRLTLETFWSEENFSKQYPTFRPHAQWSRIIGRTHSSEYVLWREGEVASDRVKQFTENAISTDLDPDAQGQHGIFDAFNGPNINSGVGSSRTQLFLDSRHHMVSLLMRVIPSPDWFVGVDSLSLCQDNQWLAKKLVNLKLWDAGTDKGLTFTSPNWPEALRHPIEEITNAAPHHPASSFYYPDKPHLPTIARLTLTRETVQDGGFLQRDQTVLKGEHQSKQTGSTRSITGLSNIVRQSPVTKRPENAPVGRKQDINGLEKDKRKKVKLTKEERMRRKQERRERKKKNKQNRKKKKKSTLLYTSLVTHRVRDVNCETTEWLEWSACSKTCGYGNRTRMRKVISEPSGRGRPCPVLTEEAMCGSMRGCGWSHFNSDSWGDSMGK